MQTGEGSQTKGTQTHTQADRAALQRLEPLPSQDWSPRQSRAGDPLRRQRGDGEKKKGWETPSGPRHGRPLASWPS